MRISDWSSDVCSSDLHILHKPVAFIILPIFALANTGIIIGAGWAQELSSANSLGILAGLVVGKPLGITLLCFLAVAVGICKLPLDLRWRHVFGAGLLGGIGRSEEHTSELQSLMRISSA